MPWQIIYAILSWFYQLTIWSRIYIRVILSRRFHEKLFLSSGWIPTRRDGSHLIFTIARRFLNGQTEPGAAKSDRWMSRTVCRRPARWAPFLLHVTWLLTHFGFSWFPLFLPDGVLSSVPFTPFHLSSRRPLSTTERLSLPSLQTGFRQTRHCLHHKRPPPSDRPPPPILVEGAAYDLAMRLQQHMPWHDH